MIAALYVEARGCYSDVPDCDLWDEARDARLYAGPHAIVAHPPCARWCRLAASVEAEYPQYKRGEDGGMFGCALASVRKWGGVIEHPADSYAWARYGIPRPPRSGGWIRCLCGGWTCHVEQGRYGHAARKSTWLYAFGCELPSLRWGPARSRPRARIGGSDHDPRPRLSLKEASATPVDFRDVLIAMARGVR